MLPGLLREAQALPTPEETTPTQREDRGEKRQERVNCTLYQVSNVLSSNLLMDPERAPRVTFTGIFTTDGKVQTFNGLSMDIFFSLGNKMKISYLCLFLIRNWIYLFEFFLSLRPLKKYFFLFPNFVACTDLLFGIQHLFGFGCLH